MTSCVRERNSSEKAASTRLLLIGSGVGLSPLISFTKMKGNRARNASEFGSAPSALNCWTADAFASRTAAYRLGLRGKADSFLLPAREASEHIVNLLQDCLCPLYGMRTGFFECLSRSKDYCVLRRTNSIGRKVQRSFVGRPSLRDGLRFQDDSGSRVSQILPAGGVPD